jgi:hypothetical protein
MPGRQDPRAARTPVVRKTVPREPAVVRTPESRHPPVPARQARDQGEHQCRHRCPARQARRRPGPRERWAGVPPCRTTRACRTAPSLPEARISPRHDGPPRGARTCRTTGPGPRPGPRRARPASGGPGSATAPTAATEATRTRVNRPVRWRWATPVSHLALGARTRCAPRPARRGRGVARPRRRLP